MPQKTLTPSAAGLIKLRPFCGYEHAAGQWTFQAGVVCSKEPLPSGEIASLAGKDNRSLDELNRQAMDALSQILSRAHGGDALAIRKYVDLVRGAAGSLEDLAAAQQGAVKAQAEALPDWPVLTSRNPADARRAAKCVEALAVGARAAVTTSKPSSHVDRSTIWTRTAERAFATCKINRTLVPELEANCANATKKRETTHFWKTEAQATFYYLPGGDVVIIPDWARDCVGLTLPVTPENFPAWWKVVKAAVLQHWHTSPDDYREALKTIGAMALEEYDKRNRAVAAIEQAFRNLTRVP